MDWSDLRIFLAIAREGTLGAAARKIGQSQPTMGRRLRALEQSLGQTLFQRTTDGFVLTDEGTAVLRHAERIEEEAVALERRASGAETQLDSLLRLSSSDWFGTVMLSPVNSRLRQTPSQGNCRASDRCAPLQPAAPRGRFAHPGLRDLAVPVGQHTQIVGQRAGVKIFAFTEFGIIVSSAHSGPRKRGVSRSSRTRAGRRWTPITSARMVSQGGEP
jgi:DNA-binding transcriptional LysR family regulator